MKTFKEAVLKHFPEAKESDWHRHENGGGWVENTTLVDDSAYVGVNARVYGEYIQLAAKRAEALKSKKQHDK